ncbi:MAG: DUF6249 domain-containing protein [Caulobacteraceae bacterium]
MEWELTAWIVPTVFWIFVGAVILVPIWLRSRDRHRLYETLQVAYEKGQPVAPDLVMAMRSAAAEAAIPPAERDLRKGVILLAAGLGMGVLGYGLWYGLNTIDDLSAWMTGGWIGGAGAILALIGIVYLGFWLVRRGAGAGGG